MIKFLLTAALTYGAFSFAEEAKKVEITPAVVAAKVEVNPAPPPPPVVAEIPPMPDEFSVSPKHMPPQWLEKAMDVVSSLPFVGPYIVEIAKWLGVIASLLTILVTAVLGSLKVLSAALNLAKLADLALKVNKLANGPIMYWLSFFSMYNAKKQGEKKVGDSK